MQRADATVVQVHSPTQRKRYPQAIELGLEWLRECGLRVPAGDRLPAELDHQFNHLYRWLDHTDAANDLARPDITDRTLLAATRVLNAVLPAAYLAPDLALQAWLSLEALRIWLEHGPSGTLLGPASHTATAAIRAAVNQYPTIVAHLVRGLDLAEQARTSHEDERGGLPAELDDVTQWLATATANAPDNFRHLLRLVEAERAWAIGDFRAGALAFDAARREVTQRQRPWHRALIAERAGRFNLAHGLEHAACSSARFAVKAKPPQVQDHGHS